MRLALAFVLLCVGLGACGAKAPATDWVDCTAVPPLTGRIVDKANLISPAAKRKLTQELQQLEARTGDQLVVVTLPSLDGRPIEETGVALGRCWHIGEKGLDNGILLLVAVADRKARIEVGSGLEGLVTDPHAKRIMDEEMIPSFKAQQFEAGIEAGVASIDRLLSSDTRRPQRLPPPART